MSSEQVQFRSRGGWAYVAGILGALLIVAGLVWAMRRYTEPAPLGEDRAAVRARALQEVRAAETEALEHTAWLDQGKGLVRLPIERAIWLVERDWSRDPAAGRSNLLARLAKATAEPPKAPEKPSEFE
jgi:hypothetical protein